MQATLMQRFTYYSTILFGLLAAHESDRVDF